MKKIIVNGDDFAYSEGVNRGIIQAYQEGILTSTTVMANLLTGREPYLQNLKSSKVTKPSLGIGVHLNLTSGEPLSTSWTEGKLNRPLRGKNDPKEWQGSIWRKYISSFTIVQIKEEYEAQVQKTKEVFGSIDHVDSHHSSASYFPAMEAYFELAKKYNLAVRPLAQLSENSQYGGEMIIEKDFYQKAKQKGVRTVDSAELRYLKKEDFYKVLESIKDGELVEFMFHPAIDSSRGEWRVADYDLLTSSETLKRIKDLKLTLTTYAESSS